MGEWFVFSFDLSLLLEGDRWLSGVVFEWLRLRSFEWWLESALACCLCEPLLDGVVSLVLNTSVSDGRVSWYDFLDVNERLVQVVV